MCLCPIGIEGIVLIADIEIAFVLNHKGFDKGMGCSVSLCFVGLSSNGVIYVFCGGGLCKYLCGRQGYQ